MATTLTVPPNSLLSFLGFTNGQSGYSIMSNNSYIFPFDEYVSIWIDNLGVSSQDIKQCTYKIPVNPNTSNTIFWSTNNYNKQLVVNQNKHFPLDKLNISVIDQYGNQLDNNGIDWSMSIEINSST